MRVIKTPFHVNDVVGCVVCGARIQLTLIFRRYVATTCLSFLLYFYTYVLRDAVFLDNRELRNRKKWCDSLTQPEPLRSFIKYLHSVRIPNSSIAKAARYQMQS